MPEEAPEHEELFDYYCRRGQAGETPPARRTREAPPQASMPWDSIDKSLVGCLQHQEIFQWGRRCRVVWVAPLEQLSKGYTPVWVSPPARTEVPQVRVAWWLTETHLKELEETLLQPATGSPMPSAPCGLFGVLKAAKEVLRVIFDARPANVLLVPRPERLILFTLQLLVQTVAEFRYISTVDYRHWYYQFALPERPKWLLSVRWGWQRWLPRALPMGWREAVVIAQTAAWGVVLFAEDGDPPLGLTVEARAGLYALPTSPMNSLTSASVSSRPCWHRGNLTRSK